MAYVKSYDPGQIKIDLPTANYIHELPLLSIGDLRESLGLSMVFNYSLKNTGGVTFGFPAGYKLNLQKRLLISSNTPRKLVDASGKIIDVIGHSVLGSHLFTLISQSSDKDGLYLPH